MLWQKMMRNISKVKGIVEGTAEARTGSKLDVDDPWRSTRARSCGLLRAVAEQKTRRRMTRI